MPGLTRTVLPALLHADRALALAVYAVAAAPLLLLVYALVGSPVAAGAGHRRHGGRRVRRLHPTARPTSGRPPRWSPEPSTRAHAQVARRPAQVQA